MAIQNSSLVFEYISFEVLAHFHLLHLEKSAAVSEVTERMWENPETKVSKERRNLRSSQKTNAVLPVSNLNHKQSPGTPEKATWPKGQWHLTCPGPAEHSAEQGLYSCVPHWPHSGFRQKQFLVLGPEPVSAQLVVPPAAASDGVCLDAAFPAVSPVVLIAFFFFFSW